MQKIGDSTSTANGAKEYTQGQPGSGVVATLITPQWLNAVQRELVNVVLGAGIALDTADDSQVFKAIQAIQAAANTWSELDEKPTTVSGFGITDAYTKVEVQQAITDLVASIQSQGATAFTTAGTAPAFTLTPVPAISSYAAPLRFRVKFNAAAPSGGTLNVSGKGVKNLKQYDWAGNKVAAVITADLLTDVEYDGTDFVIRDPLPVDPWAMRPIGEPFPLYTHLAGVTEPPTNNAYRYIKLTASDAYNAGVLTSETVSGAAPLVVASAVISLAGSPMNGQSVSLVNTERRVIRAGQSGQLDADQYQGHRMAAIASSFVNGGSLNVAAGSAYAGGVSVNATTGGSVTDTVNGTPRFGDETRAKSIGATFYMRIK